MLRNARILYVLWIALGVVLGGFGCGGDAFQAASPQPGVDAGGDGPFADATDADAAMPDTSDDGADGALDAAQDAPPEAQLEADAPATGLTLSPDPLDFGDQQLATTSAPLGLTVLNSGQTSLPKPAFTFIGAYPNDFAVLSNDCPAGGLGPSASCVAQIAFTPSDNGAREATIAVLAGTGAVAYGSVRGNGLTPAALALDPTAVDFATVVVPNASSPVAIKVTNIGGSNTPALTTTIEPSSSPFAITSNTCVGTQLSPGADCSVSVTFTPVSAGAVGATLHVGAAGLTDATTDLAGTGVSAGSLVMSPSSADLGSVTVGEAGAVQYFNVTNQGPSATSTLSVEREGTNAAEFTIASDGCTGGTLQVNGSCVVGVRLEPQSAGSKIATLMATATTGGTATSSLTGTGLRPAQLTMVPTAQDFGTVAPGVTGGPFTFTVTNTGESKSGALTVSKAGVDASQFSIDSATTCGVALDPSASCVIVMRFAPTSDGQKAAVVHATAAPGGDVTAALTGFSGTPALAIAPASWDFGSLAIGTPSALATFTVKNTGNVQSGLPTTTLVQAATTDFKVTNNTCTTALAPQATCTIGIKFTPTVAGQQAATLQVTADPGGTVVASLQGRGLTPAQLTLAPGSADFGTVPVGQSSADIIFTLTNAGETATSALALALAGSQPDDFSYVTTCPNNALAGGASCFITVTFSPTAASVRQATLTASATAGGTVSAALTGTGTSQAALTITPSSNDYGSVALTGSSAFTYVVKNTGGLQSGTLQMLLGDTSNFVIPSGGDGCSGQQLGVSATCTVVVQFRPQSAGTKETALTAQANPGGTATAALKGYGLGPALLSLSPASFTYPLVNVGSSSAPVFFTLSNDGASDSGPLAISLTGADASSYVLADSSSNPCTAGSPLAVGASCTIGVSFAPTSYGVKTASLSVTADPGGSPTATLVGGTPDIFVSMTGNDANDGRTPDTAVRHITQGLSMASAGWTVHVAYATAPYGADEKWPLEVPDGVALLGSVNSAPYPAIEPPANTDQPVTIVKLSGTAPSVARLEIRSGAGTTSNLSTRTVVQLTGVDPRMDSCLVQCQTDSCVAVQATSSGKATVTNTTASLKGKGTGLKASATSGGQVSTDHLLVECPAIPNVTSTVSVGVDVSAGTLFLQNGKVSQCVHGVMVSSSGSLQMRGTAIVDSYLYGVEINLGSGSTSVWPDLGTASKPGDNTIRSTKLTSVGLAVKSLSTSVNAVGNTWVPNQQNSDAQGHYPPQWVHGPVQPVGAGNYSIVDASSGIQF